MINDLLRREVKDPRLHGVHVSNVDLSGDLGVAKVYFSTLDPDADPGPVSEALESAGGFIRRNIGREIRLRRVPELRFLHDDSARRGIEISHLIDQSREQG